MLLKSVHDLTTPLLVILSQLHWLPIEARIRHKLAVLTFSVSTGKTNYVAEIVHTHTPAMERRSSSQRPNQLHVPHVRTAFRHAAPAVWNGLPSEITDASLSLETFKYRLKTYLYNQSFRCWSCYRSASAIWSTVKTATNRNGDSQNGDKAKTATNHNGDKLKRRQTETAPFILNKPKRQQSKWRQSGTLTNHNGVYCNRRQAWMAKMFNRMGWCCVLVSRWFSKQS